MTTETWLLLSLALFAGATSPGPSLALVVRTALTRGRLAGLAVAVSHGLAVGFYAFLLVLGVGEAINSASWVMGVLQAGGVFFLVYLSVMMIRGGFAATRQINDQDRGPSQYVGELSNGAPSLDISDFRAGFLIAFLNPKVLVFFLAIFSQFLTPEQPLGTKLSAAGLAAAIDALWYVGIALLISVPGVSSAFGRLSGPLDIGFGLFLGCVALWMGVSLI